MPQRKLIATMGNGIRHELMLYNDGEKWRVRFPDTFPRETSRKVAGGYDTLDAVRTALHSMGVTIEVPVETTIGLDDAIQRMIDGTL